MLNHPIFHMLMGVHVHSASCAARPVNCGRWGLYRSRSELLLGPGLSGGRVQPVGGLSWSIVAGSLVEVS